METNERIFINDLIELCNQHNIIEKPLKDGFDYIANLWAKFLDRWVNQCRKQEEKGHLKKEEFDDYAKGYMDACHQITSETKSILIKEGFAERYGIKEW